MSLTLNLLSVIFKDPGCDLETVVSRQPVDDMGFEKILGEYRDHGDLTYDEVDGRIVNIRLTPSGVLSYYAS